MKAVHVSVVVPVYRNAATLAELHRRVTAALEGLTWELIFVDDACPGGSATVLAELASADERVGVVSLAANVGQHRAVLCGLAHARGELAVVLDADLQDPPEAIPDLVQAARHGAAVVFAARRGRYEAAGRRMTSRIFKILLHFASGVPVDAGMFVLLNREAITRVLALESRWVSVVGLIGCSGLSHSSLPVTRVERSLGGSAYSGLGRLKSGLAALACVSACRLPGAPDWLRAPRPPRVRERLGAPFAQ